MLSQRGFFLRSHIKRFLVNTYSKTYNLQRIKNAWLYASSDPVYKSGVLPIFSLVQKRHFASMTRSHTPLPNKTVHGSFDFRNSKHCLHLNFVRHSSYQDYMKKRDWLFYFMMSSFVIGGILLLLLLQRWIKNQKRRSEGFENTSLPGLARPRLVKHKDIVLPSLLEPVIPKLENFHVRDDDVYLVSYPRSGLIWLQEIVFLIQTGDYDKANTVKVEERSPYLEFSDLEELNKAPSPRLIRSHLPLKILPKGVQESQAKVVYIARNSKDVALSYFLVVKLFQKVFRFNGDLSNFCDSFTKHKVPFSPWPEHVLAFWNKRDEKNVLFLMYEDLSKDIEGSIRTIANFLGKKVTDEEVQKIKEHCSFNKMKENTAVNYNIFKGFAVPNKTSKDFFRKGKVGEWLGSLSQDDVKKLDFMIALNLKGTGLAFDYGINKETAAEGES